MYQYFGGHGVSIKIWEDNLGKIWEVTEVYSGLIRVTLKGASDDFGVHAKYIERIYET